MGDRRNLIALTLLTGVLGLGGPSSAQPDFSKSPCHDPSLKPNEYIDEHLVYFDHGSAELPERPGTDIVLRSAVCWINRGATSVQLIAQADTSGEDAYNLELSERRGRRVAAELVRRGVEPSLISVKAWGEARLAVATGDGVREPLNRLVVITWGGGL